ncbi:MAG: HAD-IA family hydrolase [Deltaproteobacteria bacterium]|nr:HAD-IA family hydrolase [Deltaproteobacteria bacterium]
MAIKAVFFDAAGTLIKPLRSVGQTYALVAEKYGVEASSTEVAERFRVCFDASPPLAFPAVSMDSIEWLEREWWKQRVQCVFEPWGRFDQFDRFFAELFAYFAQPEAWTLYPEVSETLPALRKRGLILDVISNFDSRLIGILEGLGVAQWLEEIFISSRVGYAKPTRQIFDKALTQHNLTPAEAMHVGDSEETDLCGAVNAGVKGVLIDRGSNTSPNGSLRIKNLNEIISILDQAWEPKKPA